VDSNTAKVVVFDFDLPESQNPLYSNTIRYHQNIQASATRYSNPQQGATSYFGTWTAFVSTPFGFTGSSIGLYSPYGTTRLFSSIAASVNPVLFTFPRGAVATYFTESNTHAYMTVTDAGIFSTYITPTVSNATTTNTNLYSNANSLGFIIRDTALPNSNMMYSFLYHNSTLFHHSTLIGCNTAVGIRTSNAVHNFMQLTTSASTIYLAPGLPPSTLGSVVGITLNPNTGWFSLWPPCEVSYGLQQSSGGVTRATVFSNGSFISTLRLIGSLASYGGQSNVIQRSENALFVMQRTGATFHAYSRISTNCFLTEGLTESQPGGTLPSMQSVLTINTSGTRTGAVFHIAGTSNVSGTPSTARIMVYYNMATDRFESTGVLMSNYQNWYSTYEKRTLFY
jgi:hypothetical protein